MSRQFILGVVATLLAAAAAVAQGPQPPPNAPTTVQLPTFSFFTVQTTVSVPDSGGALLGGLGRGADGSNSRGVGPLRNRSAGSSRGASGMSVSASIIDNQELDQAVFAQAAAKNGKNIAGAEQAGLISRQVARADASSPAAVLPDSVAAIRQQQSADSASRSAEAADLFAKAQKAEAEGKPGLAKIYYQMVLRRDAGQVRQLAQARLTVLSAATLTTAGMQQGTHRDR